MICSVPRRLVQGEGVGGGGGDGTEPYLLTKAGQNRDITRDGRCSGAGNGRRSLGPC